MSVVSDEVGISDSYYSGRLPQSDQVNHIIGRKRKRDDETTERTPWDILLIKTHGTSHPGSALQLEPKTLLPRHRLPIAFVNHAASSQPRIFAANLHELDSHVGTGIKDTPEHGPENVLIAQCRQSGRLCSIECLSPGIHAITFLAKGLDLDRLVTWSNRQKISQTAPARWQEASDQHNGIWWERLVLEAGADAQHTGSHSQTGRPPVISFGPPTGPLNTPIEINAKQPPEADATQEGQVDLMKNDTPTLDEVAAQVHAQYQHALYSSNTPLTYFAKGPLSRARTVLQSELGHEQNLARLIEFFRSLILPLAMFDKKYREILPDILKNLPCIAVSDDEISTQKSSKKAKKARKRAKVGKNGLHHDEQSSILRWWKSIRLSPSMKDDEVDEQRVKDAAVQDQRVRETQMQIILILETMALEFEREKLPTNSHQSVQDDDSQPKKRSKKQDLDMMLDLLVDRLGIWQSMSLDETDSRPRGNMSGQPPAKRGKTDVKSDTLKQFCTEVILPFFGSRLPKKKTTVICQKLRGSVNSSPPRKDESNAISPRAVRVKTDKPLPSSQTKKVRRPLQRVLTDASSNKRERTPQLVRSTTEPSLPHIKQEPSETSLASVPRGRLDLTRRYSQREVDLSAAHKATQIKLSKKASIEHELEGAIEALKKPNARMAVRDVVDASERRIFETQSRRQKQRYPVHNAFAQAAQVMATPRKQPRTATSFVAEDFQYCGAELPPVDQISSETAANVPCSAKKGDIFVRKEAGHQRPHEVARTPTKGKTLPTPSHPTLEPRRPESTLSVPVDAWIPMEQNYSPVASSITSKSGQILATPVKAMRGKSDMIDTTPIKTRLPLTRDDLDR